jgi:hypothetical protein
LLAHLDFDLLKELLLLLLESLLDCSLDAFLHGRLCKHDRAANAHARTHAHAPTTHRSAKAVPHVRLGREVVYPSAAALARDAPVPQRADVGFGHLPLAAGFPPPPNQKKKKG